MGKIKCPECGHSFDLTASDYESVVSQVRNAEFEKELQSRMKTLESTYEDKLELQLQKHVWTQRLWFSRNCLM